MNKKLLDFRKLSDEEQFSILHQHHYDELSKVYTYFNLSVGSIVVLGTQESPIFIEANQYHRHFRDRPRRLNAGIIRRQTKIAKLLKQLP